jgi:hypothetical protein
MSAIMLNVVGDSFEIPVPVSADHTFILERDRKALDEDASVRPNRKANSMTWRTEIRTPGLPPGTLRLGDMRLECHVGLEAGLVSNEVPGLGAIATLMRKIVGFCDASDAPYLFFAERPLFSVTLTSGERRYVLPVDELYAGVGHGRVSKADLAYCDCEVLLDRTYFLPLGDRSWPDDTRIELEYMEDDVPAIAGGTKAGIAAAHGKATSIIAFDSGFEVWIYQAADSREKRKLDGRELIVLLDPSGVVRKSRIRTGRN